MGFTDENSILETPMAENFLVAAKFIFAMSPLLALGVIFWNAYDDPQEEEKRRHTKKGGCGGCKDC